MRNGNYGQSVEINRLLTSSYPTYEEWKLSAISSKEAPVFSSSYPTYEEWKPLIFMFLVNGVLCSYPTYEEWKLLKNNINQLLFYLRFLSYL